jgi:ribonuclease BN (tRNA processing enzyme)
MELRFWGVRGSIPTPGSNTAEVGGNTTCFSLRLKGYIFVFDAGTGIRELGKYLEDKDRAFWKGSLLLTHYHWDHIQGLPFSPVISGRNRLTATPAMPSTIRITIIVLIIRLNPPESGYVYLSGEMGFQFRLWQALRK